MSWLVGVDGGGTKTVALVADARGRVVGRGVGGPSNPHAVGASAARAALEVAIAEAFEAAGVAPEGRWPAALCLGVAGAGDEVGRSLFRAWGAARYPGVPLRLVHDGELVLAAGTPQGWGVAVISGTGSLVFGREEAGRTARADGWGYLLGDEGSGYALGLAALRAVAQAADGRGPSTALTAAVLARWGLRAPRELVARVYGGEDVRRTVAALAPLVEATAAAGDEVARAIVRSAGEALACSAAAVVRALGVTGRVPCALAGGVLVRGREVRRAFLEAAARRGLRLAPVALVAEPAEGAIRLLVTGVWE